MTCLERADISVLETWVTRGGDVNYAFIAQMPEGRAQVPLLVYAAMKGQDAVVEWLLARGGDPDIAIAGDPTPTDADGHTPLMRACLTGHAPVVRRLLRAGAKLAQRSASGHTAIQLAEKLRHADCAREFKEHLLTVAEEARTLKQAADRKLADANLGDIVTRMTDKKTSIGPAAMLDELDKAIAQYQRVAAPDGSLSTNARAASDLRHQLQQQMQQQLRQPAEDALRHDISHSQAVSARVQAGDADVSELKEAINMLKEAINTHAKNADGSGVLKEARALRDKLGEIARKSKSNQNKAQLQKAKEARRKLDEAQRMQEEAEAEETAAQVVEAAAQARAVAQAAENKAEAKARAEAEAKAKAMEEKAAREAAAREVAARAAAQKKASREAATRAAAEQKAAREAEQKTAREAAAREAAAREAAAREAAEQKAALEAEQKMARDAAAWEAVEQNAAREAAAREVEEKAARDAAAMAEIEAAREAAGRDSVERAAPEMATRQPVETPVAHPPSPIQLTLNEIANATLYFDASGIVGRGGCGIVFLAKAMPALNGSDIAIKRLAVDEGDAVRREVELLSRCRHNHLMALSGYCYERAGPCLAYPLAHGGNLEDRLLRTSGGLERLALLGCHDPLPLPWQARCRILTELLRALSYLHSLTPQVLHRDVKPSNILLDAADRVLLSDVGLAKEATAEQQTHLSTRHVSGTPGYLDPLITNGLQHSTLTDGYAVAVTILVALVARPGVGLKGTCRHMLKHPTRPERWEAPGVPDQSAGCWPAKVVAQLATMVMGLTEEFAEDRLSLADALEELEQLVQASGAAPAAAPTATSAESTPAVPSDGTGGAAVPTGAPKECVMCLDAPREVRFNCGHAVCCSRCVDKLRVEAQRWATVAADLSTTEHERERASGMAKALCPQCRTPIGGMLAPVDDDAAPTFQMVAPPREEHVTRPEPHHDSTLAQRPPLAARAGRGGRGARGGRVTARGRA